MARLLLMSGISRGCEVILYGTVYSTEYTSISPSGSPLHRSISYQFHPRPLNHPFIDPFTTFPSLPQILVNIAGGPAYDLFTFLQLISSAPALRFKLRPRPSLFLCRLLFLLLLPLPLRLRLSTLFFIYLVGDGAFNPSGIKDGIYTPTFTGRTASVDVHVYIFASC